MTACFAELNVETHLYAIRHDEKLCYRPLEFGVNLSTPSSTGTAQDNQNRTHSLRDVFDAIFYVLKTGCQ